MSAPLTPRLRLSSLTLVPIQRDYVLMLLGTSETSQSTAENQHSPLACPPAEAPTPRQHSPTSMAKHTLPHRNPRSRNRACRNVFSTAAPATTALEQYITILTSVPPHVYGRCGARCITLPLAGVGRDVAGGCER